jgi:hypothetical protein
MRVFPFVFALVACGTPAPEVPAEAPVEAPAEAKVDEKADEHASMKTDAVIKDGWAHYGTAFTSAQAQDCGAVIDGAASLENQTVRVTGRIDNVCQKAGCWLVIADADGEYLRVSMKDHAFGVPMDTKTGEGTMADIEGTLVKKELDAKTLEHLKSEAKGTPEELEKQFAPKYEIVATGVAVKLG